MGHIAELDWPEVRPVGLPETSRETVSNLPPDPATITKRVSCIANDTPLVPRAAAEAVWEEACLLLGAYLPTGWITALADKAETLYQRRASFRRGLRDRGDIGRDRLWNFMRHWLAALLHQHYPELYRKLPRRYAVGGH